MVSTRTISPYARWFYYGAMAIALSIGALQIYRFDGGWVTNYGADVFGTIWLYAMFRQGRTLLQRGPMPGPETTAAVVFAGCAASEFAQRVHVVPGVFDPFDLVAFAAGIAACLLVDLLVLALA